MAREELDAGGTAGIIWVDSDGYEVLGEQYKPLIVTTVEKHMKPAILEAISSKLDGSFAGGHSIVGTLENEGVGLAPFHDWDAKIPAELKAEVEQLREQIISGQIKVESPSSP